MRNFSVFVLGFAAWIGLGLAGPAESGAQTLGSGQGVGDSQPKSFTSSVKAGVDKFTSAVTLKPPVTPADDPVSLSSKATTGPGLYVAVARLYEQRGRPAEAAQQYERALKESPDNLPALLGYARLKDGMDLPEEAVQLYQRAAKAHPKEPAVFNNWGLYYARRGAYNDAVTTLNRAIQLKPDRPMYRNNIATVLVEMGQMKDAFGHLAAVHSEAAAYYNLGYLLHKKGMTEAARRHFAMAQQVDPSFKEAQQWVAKLSGHGATDQGRLANDPSSNPPVRLGSRPSETNWRVPPPENAVREPSPPAERTPVVQRSRDRQPVLDEPPPARHVDRAPPRSEEPVPEARMRTVVPRPENGRPWRLPPTSDALPEPHPSKPVLEEDSPRQLISPVIVGPDRRLAPP